MTDPALAALTEAIAAADKPRNAPTGYDEWAAAILAHPAMADLARKAAAVDALDSLPRIISIVGPHDPRATSRWLVKAGNSLYSLDSIAAIAAALEQDSE